MTQLDLFESKQEAGQCCGVRFCDGIAFPRCLGGCNDERETCGRQFWWHGDEDGFDSLEEDEPTSVEELEFLATKGYEEARRRLVLLREMP